MHKSRTAQLDLLNNISTQNFDIILIQEPHIDHLNLKQATLHWRVLYPSKYDKQPQKTRAVSLISTKIISDKVQQIKTESSDIVALTISTSIGCTDIYNIYLDGTHSDELISL